MMFDDTIKLYAASADDNNHYGDGWEQMSDVVEEVPVLGAASVPVTLSFTRHGPVIHADPQRNLAFAVRAAWLEAGMAPYLGSVLPWSIPGPLSVTRTSRSPWP